MNGVNFNSILNILKIIVICSPLCQAFNNSLEHEQQMPDLYKFDNYQDCIKRNISNDAYPARYCMVFVELQPKENSLLWQRISFESSIKFNYFHNRIFRGVCTQSCEHFTPPAVQHNITSDNGLLVTEETKKFEEIFDTALDRTMRSEHHNEIHNCINQEYMEIYNLSAKTFISYCVDPQERKEKDIYFYLFLLLIFIILTLNIGSSVYDAKLKMHQLKSNEKYYEVKPHDKSERYLTAFSIYRNYKRLVVPNKSDIGIDLGFLDGFRSILCFLIVLEHTFLLQYAPIENTDFVENSLHLFVTEMFLHALVWLELFFVLSGIFLFVKFEKAQYVTPKSSLIHCCHVYGRLLFSRYLRYLPSLLFVIIVHANVSYYKENDTFSRLVVESNCMPCRNDWLLNLLMINNFYMESSCLMHTWYIAADFHLYGLFLFILIIMAKYPNSQLFILVGVAIIAGLVNFGVGYIMELDSIFTLTPESFRYHFFHNIETAKYLYFSSYTNINPFLVGIICGLIYMKHLRNNTENKKKLGKLLKYSPYVGWPSIVAILYVGTIILKQTETTIWTAAYCLLHRHVGITIVAIIVVLRGMCIGKGFLKSPVFRLLSRISFQVYLWQIVILLNMLSEVSQPIHINVFFIFILGISLYVSASVVGLVVALTVEYPIAEIINTIDIEKKIIPTKSI